MTLIFIVFITISLSSTIIADTYVNPVINFDDVPDPGAIYYKGKYYVATTTDFNDIQDKFPIHESDDLKTWTKIGAIFPKGTKPSWSTQDFWAPEIHVINGNLVAYFVARDTTGVLCVGVAVANDIVGPWKAFAHPFVRNSTVGNIDPTYFYDQDSGQGYLIWKEDGNGANPPEKYTPIWMQRLSKDGLTLLGDKEEILKNDPNSWEGILVEAPWMIKVNETYYLFYSANSYASPYYAVGVARSDTGINGPYVKYAQNPILHSNDHFQGPGHCAVIKTASNSEWVMIYHSWKYNQILTERVMLLDAIQWTSDNWPIIATSSPSYQPTHLPN